MHYLVAAGCIVVIYLCGVTGQWWPTPDSALYLSLARSLARGEGYLFNGQVSTDVTPGFPLILAGIQRTFGAGFAAQNLFMTLSGLASLAVIFVTVARVAHRHTALLVTLLAAFSYPFYLACHVILTDIAFVLLFWGLIYCCIRLYEGSLWWLAAMAVLIVLSLTIRIPGLLPMVPLILGVVVDLLARRRIRRAILVGGVCLGLAAALAIGFYLLSCLSGTDRPLYSQSAAELVATSWGPLAQRGLLAIADLPTGMAEILTSQSGLWPVGLGAIVLMVAGAAWCRRTRCYLFLTLAIGCPVLLAILGGVRAIRPRYFLPAFPAMVLLMIVGLQQLLAWIRGRLSLATFPRPTKEVVLFILLLAAMNLPRLLRDAFYYSYSAHTGRYYQVIRNGHYEEFFAAARFLEKRLSPDASAAIDTKWVSQLYYAIDRHVLTLPSATAASPTSSPSDWRRARYVVISHEEKSLAPLTAEALPPGSKAVLPGRVFSVYELP
ncbi:MAG: glycosyltransferase family 39 protein [Phycisphaerae bacterium]|nr:glycosyltransferase family 39 protein [Phycisphaerae bacterium]